MRSSQEIDTYFNTQAQPNKSFKNQDLPFARSNQQGDTRKEIGSFGRDIWKIKRDSSLGQKSWRSKSPFSVQNQGSLNPQQQLGYSEKTIENHSIFAGNSIQKNGNNDSNSNLTGNQNSIFGMRRNNDDKSDNNNENGGKVENKSIHGIFGNMGSSSNSFFKRSNLEKSSDQQQQQQGSGMMIRENNMQERGRGEGVGGATSFFQKQRNSSREGNRGGSDFFKPSEKMRSLFPNSGTRIGNDSSQNSNSMFFIAGTNSLTSNNLKNQFSSSNREVEEATVEKRAENDQGQIEERGVAANSNYFTKNRVNVMSNLFESTNPVNNEDTKNIDTNDSNHRDKQLFPSSLSQQQDQQQQQQQNQEENRNNERNTHLEGGNINGIQGYQTPRDDRSYQTTEKGENGSEEDQEIENISKIEDFIDQKLSESQIVANNNQSLSPNLQHLPSQQQQQQESSLMLNNPTSLMTSSLLVIANQNPRIAASSSILQRTNSFGPIMEQNSLQSDSETLQDKIVEESGPNIGGENEFSSPKLIKNFSFGNRSINQISKNNPTSSNSNSLTYSNSGLELEASGLLSTQQIREVDSELEKSTEKKQKSIHYLKDENFRNESSDDFVEVGASLRTLDNQSNTNLGELSSRNQIFDRKNQISDFEKLENDTSTIPFDPTSFIIKKNDMFTNNTTEQNNDDTSTNKNLEEKEIIDNQENSSLLQKSGQGRLVKISELTTEQTPHSLFESMEEEEEKEKNVNINKDKNLGEETNQVENSNMLQSLIKDSQPKASNEVQGVGFSSLEDTNGDSKGVKEGTNTIEKEIEGEDQGEELTPRIHDKSILYRSGTRFRSLVGRRNIYQRTRASNKHCKKSSKVDSRSTKGLFQRMGMGECSTRFRRTISQDCMPWGVPLDLEMYFNLRLRKKNPKDPVYRRSKMLTSFRSKITEYKKQRELNQVRRYEQIGTGLFEMDIFEMNKKKEIQSKIHEIFQDFQTQNSPNFGNTNIDQVNQLEIQSEHVYVQSLEKLDKMNKLYKSSVPSPVITFYRIYLIFQILLFKVDKMRTVYRNLYKKSRFIEGVNSIDTRYRTELIKILKGNVQKCQKMQNLKKSVFVKNQDYKSSKRRVFEDKSKTVINQSLKLSNKSSYVNSKKKGHSSIFGKITKKSIKSIKNSQIFESDYLKDTPNLTFFEPSKTPFTQTNTLLIISSKLLKAINNNLQRLETISKNLYSRSCVLKSSLVSTLDNEKSHVDSYLQEVTNQRKDTLRNSKKTTKIDKSKRSNKSTKFMTPPLPPSFKSKKPSKNTINNLKNNPAKSRSRYVVCTNWSDTDSD